VLVILLLYISTFTNLRNYIIFVNKPLALKIKRARKESKMSQRELGEALGVSDKAISSYESGRAVPRLNTLQKLAKITHRPVGYFTNTETENIDYSVASMLANVEKQLIEIKKLLNEATK